MNQPLRVQIAAFTATRLVFNTMHRMVYPFLSAFARGLGMDLSVISMVLSARALVGAFSPLLGALADSRGRKAGMLLGVALFVAGVALVVVWPSVPAFIGALLLALVGNLVFIPSMQAYLGDRIPYERRGRAIAITEISWSLGFMAGVPLMGLLIERLGWNAPFLPLALLGILALIGLAWLLPGDQPVNHAQANPWVNFGQVFASRLAWAGLILGLCFSAANEIVNLVFGVWMEDAFGLKIAALGLASILIGCSELGGEALSGGLVDRVGKPRAVAIGLLLNSLAAIALPIFGYRLEGALAILFLFYLSFEFTLVSSLPMMTEILPSTRATLMAVNIASISLGRALGAALAPVVFSHGIWASGTAAVIFNIAALGALWRLNQGLRGGAAKAVDFHQD